MIKDSLFLYLAAAGLTPVALAYGLAPDLTVPQLYGVPVDTVSTEHVFRAVMGLYLAMVVFWILGARRESLRFAALCSVAVFMLGLAAGRALSLLVDGTPATLLAVYLLLEIGFGVVAIVLARQHGAAG